MDRWLVNGVDATTISLNDRGLQYADGLFETIAVRAGQPRFLDRHLARLSADSQRLGMPPTDSELLAREVGELANGCAHGAAKIVMTRGAGPRGYRPPTASMPTRLVGIGASAPPPAAYNAEGVVARSCETPLASTPATAGIKTLGRLEHVLARAEWDDPEISEGLMSDADGRVVCGTMTNLFFVTAGQLYTPLIETSGVAGIMRAIVIEQATQAGLICAARETPDAMLRDADELFVTNSLIGIWPVRRLDDTDFPIGAVTRMLMQRLAAIGIEECGR